MTYALEQQLKKRFMKNSLILLILFTLTQLSYADITLGYIAVNDNAECTGSDPDQNIDFQDWYISQSSQILTAATTDCGGTIMINDDYSSANWVMTSSCESEVTITWTVSDDCGSPSVSTSATYLIEDSQPPFTNVNDLTISVNCLSEIEQSAPPLEVTDACDGIIDIQGLPDFSGVICETEGVVLFEYTIEDECGNVNAKSPITFTYEIDPNPSNQLQWLNPDDNLPSDIGLILNENECQSDYSFPGCVWSEDITDPNAQTWPFPLLEGVHWISSCGATFTSSHTPCPISPNGGSIIVTYTLEDGCGETLIHEFEIDPECANCSGANGVFCPVCEDAIADGCFTCNVNDLLQGFASCNPPYQGGIQGPPQPQALCNGQGVPNNMSWFAFVAGSPLLQIEVCPSDCIPSGGSIGIQAGIYDSCNGDCIAGDGSCPNTLECKDFSLSDMIVGNTYYLFVDGCNGAECNYDIAISGQEAYILDNMESVIVETECSSTLDGNYCAGQSVRFNVLHDGSSPTDNGQYNDPGSYNPELDLCYEWSAFPQIDGLSDMTFSQISNGGQGTPLINLPIVDVKTDYQICIENIYGPCDEPCDDADCVGDCCVTITVLPSEECFVSDSCTITNLLVETNPCSADSIYTIDFEFDYNSPNCNGFTATSNGITLGSFDYGQDSYSLGPFNCGGIAELTINDNINNCNATIAVADADCCIGTTCEITELTSETLPCNSNGFYFVDFSFLIENPGIDGFIARGDGNEYGTFDYGQSTYRIGPFENCGDIEELIIIDSNFSSCSSAILVDTPDCCIENDNCAITELTAETLPCSTDSIYFVDFSFVVSNPGISGFTARGNGTVFGSFDYGENLYRIGPFDSCDEINELVIIDNEDDACNTAISIDAPDCCEQSEECAIENLVILSYNITTDSFLQVTFDFTHTGTADVGFDLFVDGTFYSFNDYMDVPYDIIIDQFDTEGTVTIEVCDNDNPDCCSNITLNLEDMGLCTFQNLEAIQTECVDDSYFYIINFSYPLDQDTMQFELSGNGNSYGSYNLSDLPVTIGPFDTAEIINELNVNIINQIDCVTIIELDPECDLIDSNNEIISDHTDIRYIREIISINSDLNIESECYIFDVVGQLSYKTTFQNHLNISTDDYETGIYLIHIRNTEGYMTEKIFIVK